MRVNELLLKKKIVIFGCGYIGEKLAEACLKLGWEVTALTRNPVTAKSLNSKSVKTIVANLMNHEWHSQISLDQNYLVDCVGAAEPNLEGYDASYRKGMRSILEWVNKTKKPLDALLFTSSTSVYPQTDGSLVTEQSNHEGVSERGKILLEAERLCLSASSDKVLKRVVLRFAGLYGPNRHLLLNHVREGRQLKGASHRILNLLHQTDAVSSILSCLNAQTISAETTFNVSDNRHASRGEIVEWLAKKMKVKNPGFDGEEKTQIPNRKIDSGKIRKSLSWSAKYSGFEAGYEDLLATH